MHKGGTCEFGSMLSKASATGMLIGIAVNNNSNSYRFAIHGPVVLGVSTPS